MYHGRIICAVKTTGDVFQVNPQSNSEMLALAPSAWWIAKGWRRTTKHGKIGIDWIQATSDLTAFGESLGAIDRATFDELTLQRGMRRYAAMRARYEPLLRAS